MSRVFVIYLVLIVYLYEENLFWCKLILLIIVERIGNKGILKMILLGDG